MRAILLIGLGTVLGAGCGSSADSGPDAFVTTYDCAADTRAEVYTPGMAKIGVGSDFNFKLISATPAPSVVGDGNNLWVVEIDGVTGGVVDGPVSGLGSDATSSGGYITVTPYMPDHQHGSPISVGITPTSTAGQYTFNPINLWMPGLWETTIGVTQGETFDKAVFSFCLSS